jgi:ABC-2 type transport system permease protein
MLKRILVIAYKELRLWLQAPGNWLPVLVVPFLLISVIGAIFSGGGAPTITVFAVNEDAGERGAEVIKLLDEFDKLDLEMLPSQTEADRGVSRGAHMAAIVIPADFSQAVLTDQGGEILLIIDPARQREAGIVAGLTQAALGKAMVDAEVERGVTSAFAKADLLQGEKWEPFRIFINAGLKAVVSHQVEKAIDEPLIKVEDEALTQAAEAVRPTLMSALAPGYSLMFVFFLLSHLATTVVQERSVGALRRLLSTPATRTTILLGKALPFFVIAALQLIAILTVSSMVFDMTLGKAPGALFGIILATAAALAGLGILIAALAKNESQAGVVTILLALAMAVVSGCASQDIQLPGISFVTPHFWALLGLENVIARGMGWDGVLLPGAVLLGMALVCFVVGARRFKFE